MNRYIYYIIVLLITLPLAGLAQDDWEKPAGGIEDAKVVIEKDKVISLRPVSRRFKSIQFEMPEAVPVKLNYQLPDANDSLPKLQVIVRPKTMKDQALDKLYSLNGKVGYGNYRSPFILLNAGTKRNDEYMLDAYFNHYSSGSGPIEGIDAPEYTTSIGGAAKYFLNNVTLFSNINNKFYTYDIYGYDPDFIVPTTMFRQRLNVLSLNAGLTDNNLNDVVDHKLDMGINYLTKNSVEPTTDKDYVEFEYKAGYKISAEFNEHWSAKANVGYSGFVYPNLAEAVVGRTRRLVELSPVVSYKLDDITASVGANVYNENDPITTGESNFHFYPTASVIYQFTKDHALSGSIGGAVEKVSMNKILNENPYISRDLQPNNNLNNFNLIAKLYGNILPNLDYSVNFQMNHYSRMMFYTNNAVDTARFDIVYDEGGVTINQLGGSLNYLLSDRLSVSTNAKYSIYTTTDIAEAWHKPTFELNFTSDFKIIDRLTGNITYSLLSGIKAETSTGDVRTLNTIHDLSMGLNLNITERTGIFIDVLNIANSNYQVYNNYPVRGIQVIGGFTFKF